MLMRRFLGPIASASAAAFRCLLALTLLTVSLHPQNPDASRVAPLQLSGDRVALRGHTVAPVLNGVAYPVGHYNPEQKLRLALGIRAPHMAEEQQFLKELQTKGSPTFHKFLTAEEWNARFAPSAEQEQKVVDWAISQGMTITHRFDNRLLVDVEAPAGVIERALHVTLNQYKYGEEIDFSNDRDPQIPIELSGIVESVAGLNSLQRFHKASSTRQGAKGPDYVAGPVFSAGTSSSGDGDRTLAPKKALARLATAQADPRPSFTNGFADPADIPYSSQSYNYSALFAQGHCCNPTHDPNGATPATSIAVVTYGNFQNSDVQGFFKNYGMAWNYYSYYIDGTGYPGQDNEAPLDVEYAAGTANSFGSYLDTAKVFVYEATNNLYSTYEDTFNFVASDGHAKVVTTSYGFSEAGFLNGNDPSIFSTMHAIFNSMNGQGITLIAAAGDNGATDDCSNTDQVSYPAADSDFIAAGGTQINYKFDGTFQSEVDWTGTQNPYNCNQNQGGGGGGFGIYQGIPYWQSFIGGGHRALPDLSLNAATGQNYFYNGKLAGVGGTSIVAPELAGFFAQENAYLLAIGNICGAGGSACAPLGNPAPFLYEEGTRNNAAHYPFYDVTQGCNSNYYTSLYQLSSFCAGAGFDEATGWGSFNALQLAWALNWEIVPAYGVPYLTWSGPATNTWYNHNQTVSWTVHDYQPANTYPGSGIAGETQDWDHIPADPQRASGPGTGNSFYSGPQIPNGATGCLALEPNGCQAGVSQGCHYAFARGWNNQGFSTANLSGYPESYGPICYDTVAPLIAVAISPATTVNGWHNKLPVSVTLAGSDPGGSGASGVVNTYYGLNNTCSTNPNNLGICTSYSSPLSFKSQGKNTLVSFTRDRAGNLSTPNLSHILIDTTAPVTATALSGTLNASKTFFTSKVALTLKATDNLSGVGATYYSLDGGAQKTYGGVIEVSGVGAHKIVVHSVDVAGNTESAKTSSFTIYSLTKTRLTASINPALRGQNVTLTAQVTADVSGIPAGKVTFKDGSTVLGTVTLSGGEAKLTTSKFNLGTNSLTTFYPGSGFDEGSSAALALAVHETTTTSLGTSKTSLPFGTPVTLTATVKASVSGTPTGSVAFFDGSTSLASVKVDTHGVAALTTTKLVAGTDAVHAAYGGDTIDAASSSPTVHINVTPAPTTIALKASTAKENYGGTVAFTVTLASVGGKPSGTVTFLDGGTKLGSINVSGGVGTFDSKTLPVGNNSILAEYAGDADFGASKSAAVSVVTDATTTTTLTVSSSTTNHGQSVTLKATVKPDAGAAATGNVTFKNGTAVLGTEKLSGGVATLTTTSLPVGNLELTAVYDGSTYDLTSTSAAVKHVVK